MLRKSSIFKFNHGNHVCVFYNSERSLTEIITPYIADGLRNHERCFCVQKASTIHQLILDLRFLGFDTDREIARGALDLHTPNEVYFPNGRFEPAGLVSLLCRSIEEARQAGFAGYRTAGELSWALEGRNECDRLIEYEQLVEQAFPSRRATGMCLYPTSQFPPDVLERVLATHRQHVFDCAPGHHAHSSMQLAFDQHTAEIVANPGMLDPQYYYVVQRKYSQEAVGWGRVSDFESAFEKVRSLTV
jgi:MEDS: MEthanogen/methylotroph, DcmR Sensory domain